MASHGASPRVRGKLDGVALGRQHVGCIPACAGEACPCRSADWRTPVHPRVCGGSLKNYRQAPPVRGASPRVRGKPLVPFGIGPDRRCIPACAGEAREAGMFYFVTEVHPRVCGGSPQRLALLGLVGGASPRVRGKPISARARLRNRGCIPACAGEAPARCIVISCLRVHPRVCGGSRGPRKRGPPFVGASPRVRGKREPFLRRLQLCRCIPACAGEAPSGPSGSGQPSVHPRVCGGSLDDVAVRSSHSGASPRVRGKRARDARYTAGRRCIPACAGEARRCRRAWSASAVHPRVCGGSTRRTATMRLNSGASPRVRGKPQAQAQVRAASRCIPACAGEAPRRPVSCLGCAVHPRVCGGSCCWMRPAWTRRGASPRVRGKRRQPPGGCGASGCIPACAGEARRCRRAWSASAVHPRVCGGSHTTMRTPAREMGASPRVRGKRRRGDRRCGPPGCIPACAGEAAAANPAAKPRKVHPRVCGGSQAAGAFLRFREGASPRVRGKPWHREVVGDGIGCIPACAGEASRWKSERPAERVHPRVCGGSRALLFPVAWAAGASPRVRGKRDHRV